MDAARGLYRTSCVTHRQRAVAEGSAEACESPVARGNAAGKLGEVAEISEVVTSVVTEPSQSVPGPATHAVLRSNQQQDST